ncbi:hypothetical protein [Rubrivirga sp.]|uniref:hypothetical protein n=1 Tax=Rubrivirga sp. TaxID=1885344 RepID=UPI003C75B473
MLRKLNGQPAWYKAWAVAVALAAVFVLARWLLGDLEPADFALMAFVHVSVLIDLFVGRGASEASGS